MPAIEETGARSRLQLSEGLRNDAKGIIKTTTEVLTIAASMTQNVPYLGMISSALTELLKIQDEVEAYKSEWKQVMGITRQIKAIVDNVRAQCEAVQNSETGLPDTLTKPFVELEKCVAKVLEVYSASKAGSARRRDRLRVYLGRGELSEEVKQCRADMQAALDLFNLKLNIDQRFEMHAMKTILIELRDKQPNTQSLATNAPLSVSLPAAPTIFCGRAREVDHVVDLILLKAPARVAVLGSGGIGKTSIALVVLHHREIKERYGDRRFFLSCEATPRATDVIQELLKMFGVAYDPKSGITPIAALLSHMRTLPDGILCMDNLETPWDADIDATQTLLSQVADVSRMALLVTTRGADRPLQVAWTRPFLPPIPPLTLDAAHLTWDSICDSHDGYSTQLVQAVDCVPLAVTLLAHLAESESSQRLWQRWERESTELLRVRGPDNRLNSVDISIQLSLLGPRLRDDAESVQLLSVICTLPHGMLESRIPAFEDAFKELLPKLSRSITVLKQCSLVYSTENGFSRVLSPIRLYMQTHHPITEPLFTCLATLYRHLVSIYKKDFAADVIYSERTIRPEMGNITAVLELCLTGNQNCLERTLAAVNVFSRLCKTLNVYDTLLLSKAITRAEHDFPAYVADLWQSMGESLLLTHHLSESLSAFTNAVELFRSVGDRTGEARTLSWQGTIWTRLGQIEEAEHALKRALELYDFHVEDPLDKTYTLHQLGALYAWVDKTDEAVRTMQSALDLCREMGDQPREANCLRTLGKMYAQLGRSDEAEDLIRSAYGLCEQIGEKLGKANCLQSLGMVYCKLGRLDEAEQTLQLALGQHREVSDLFGEVNDLNHLGRLYRRLRRHDEARAVISVARGLSINMQYMIGEGNAIFELGCINRDCGELEEARRCFFDALRLFERAQGSGNIKITRRSLEYIERKLSGGDGKGTEE